MARTETLRSVRLLPLTYGIDTLANQTGEVFYDGNTKTLRVMDGTRRGGFPIATEEFVNTELTAVESDLQGQINAAIAAIPEVDLTPYYTKTETDVLLANVSVDLTGYATETYVNNKIAAIPSVDLTGYATETYVNTAVSNLVDSAPGTLDTLNELAAALNDDANFSTTITNLIATKANTADLGSAAFEDTTFFATAFQGSLADTSLQPLDNISELVNDAGYLVSSNLSGLASETYVDTAISNLIDGAPDSLDTLNELAAALNDNANLGSEVLASIALKANTADLGAAAFSNNYNDLDNAEDWADYSEKTSGTFIAADAVTDGSPVVLNLDKTIGAIAQEQSYVFDTFTSYNTVGGTAFNIPNNRNFSPVSDSYGTLRNGPQTHQVAKLGGYIFALAAYSNDAYLSAFTENSSTGALEHIRTDEFLNIGAFTTGGVVNCTLVADTDNDQLIIISATNSLTSGISWRIVKWNSTDNLFSSAASGTIDGPTVAGDELGNSDCQKISAHYNEIHNKIFVAFDYGTTAYFGSYTATGVTVTQSTYINSATSTLGAAILFAPYELLNYIPTVDNYLLTWGYNTTSMVSVVIDSNGDPSWGTEVALDNTVQDVIVNTGLSRIAVLTQPSNIAGNSPEMYMYTTYANGTFDAREAAVDVDDGTASAFNNTSRAHFDPRTKKYLVYNFFNNGSTNRQRPAYSTDGKTWTFGTDVQAGDARIVDGHFSGDVAVHQLFYQGNNNSIRSNLYTTTTGPIVTNLTQDNLVGIVRGNYAEGAIAKVFVLGNTADNLSNLKIGDTYYVSASGALTNDVAQSVATIGTATDEDKIYVSLGGGGGANVSISDNPPIVSSSGDLWWESDTGRLKVYYQDADTAQWVDASPPISTPTTPYIVGAVGTDVFASGSPSGPYGSGFSSSTVSTGVYNITFDTALPNDTYSVVHSCDSASDIVTFLNSKSSTGFQIACEGGGSPSGRRVTFMVYNIG